MILAAHQPQYLAWLGYYHKMARCDAFVYLDRVQYKKREYQNRNRIKSPHGELWLTLPVITKGRYTQPMADVRLDGTKDWAQEHLKSLLLNYHKAPHFEGHGSYFKEIYGHKWDRLVPLCLEMDGYMRRQFGIGPKIHLESEVGSEGASTSRLISICKKLNADTYLSGQGGKGYLDEEAFAKSGIRLLYQEFKAPVYPQRFGDFLPNLAAVDLLFNRGPDECRRLLDNMLI